MFGLRTRRPLHASCSTAGRRGTNEDRAATVAIRRAGIVAVVADGMGGARAGEVASGAAVEAFLAAVVSCRGSERDALDGGFLAADEAIRKASRPGREGMGTTLVAAIARGRDVWIGNVGDSRAVIVLPDEVLSLSVEHNIVTEALRAGEISEVQAFQHPFRHAVSRSLGDSDATPDITFYSLPDGIAPAVILVGSDGLFSFVGDAELLEILDQRAALPLARAVEQLVLRALQNGSDDNVSVAAVSVQGRKRGGGWRSKVVA